ncbi:DUF6364 family protein [Flavobacterium hauense]
MDTKLTLKLDKDIIEKAKVYASTTNRSLSSIVESYFQSLTSEKKTESDEFEITAFVRSMASEKSLPTDLDEKEYFDYLSQKHQ